MQYDYPKEMKKKPTMWDTYQNNKIEMWMEFKAK